jgi:hypothetical protein
MAASSDDDEGAGTSNKELAGMFSKMIASQMEGFKLLGKKIDSSSASTRVFLEQVMSKSPEIPTSVGSHTSRKSPSPQSGSSQTAPSRLSFSPGGASTPVQRKTVVCVNRCFCFVINNSI